MKHTTCAFSLDFFPMNLTSDIIDLMQDLWKKKIINRQSIFKAAVGRKDGKGDFDKSNQKKFIVF